MSHARYLVGDVFDRLAEMPDGSVDLVLTSPPFLALRSYLPSDHPDKAKEIGSEPTPAAFIDTLLDLTEEWARVLAPHGSLCVELGDTYSGSTGSMYDARPERAHTSYAQRVHLTNERREGDGWPLAKSLCLIPELYRIALVYGINPLNGRTTPQWRARNVVRWCRPNPPVGALGDKFRPGTSDMVVACKAKDRWFDLDAVRTEHQHGAAVATGSYSHGEMGNRRSGGDDVHGDTVREIALNPNGAPPLDWWKISTEPYSGSHYATWPTELLIKPILSMCPAKVCTVCRTPSTRVVEHERSFSKVGPSAGRSEARTPNAGPMGAEYEVLRTTLGWTDCGHDAWRSGVVLDPFAGSGTTLLVATGHGRNAIGIDLDARNADLARERVGMFLEVDMGSEAVA